MTAPILELVKKLEDNKFLKVKDKKWLPQPIPKFINIPVQDIIVRFNSIINGVSNYYSFVDNRGKPAKLGWILKESLRKTIALKLKLNRQDFYKRFGKNIVLSLHNKQGKVNKYAYKFPDLVRRPMVFLGMNGFDDPVQALVKRVSTKNSMD